MIKNVYITRVNNDPDGRQYGFGVAEDGSTVYIPAFVVNTFDLDEVDIGTKNKMALVEDNKSRSDFIANAILIEDSALKQAHDDLKDEVERLEMLLTQNGIVF